MNLYDVLRGLILGIHWTEEEKSEALVAIDRAQLDSTLGSSDVPAPPTEPVPGEGSAAAPAEPVAPVA